MKAISIILPVYNVENYIVRCLDSIINQSFKSFDLIIIDDCGNDNSIQLCIEKLKLSEISYKIIYNESNKGLSETRNIGIINSQSDYILCVDSDDWIDPFMLEKLYSNAINNSADLVSCGAIEYWEATGKFQERSNLRKGIYTPDRYLNHLFNGETSAHICFRLIKKSLFEDVKFPERVVFEDVLTIPYLIRNANKIIQLSDPLYFYLQRNSDTSITRTKPINIDGFLYNFNKLQNEFESCSDLNGLNFRLYKYKILFNITYNNIKHSNKYSEIKEELRSIKAFMKIKCLVKDILILRKSMRIRFIYYLLLLKLNKQLIYVCHKHLLNKIFLSRFHQL